MEDQTLFVHATDDGLIMRADRFVPEWNRDLRSEIGEDGVIQVKVQGKTAWLVRIREITPAISVSKKHFSNIVLERESFLGYAPAPDPTVAGLMMAAIGDHRRTEAPSASAPPKPLGVVGEKLHTMAMKVHSVGGSVTLEVEGDGSSFVFNAPPELARVFGKRLYTTVMVQILDDDQD
jgi:hypothetical protein